MDPTVVAAVVGGIGLVVGTVVGALVVAATTYLTERSRVSREDRHRFTTDKRETYALFLAATYLLDSGLIGIRQEGAEWTASSRQSFVSVEAGSTRLHDLRAQLQLLAPDAVVVAVDELIRLVPPLLGATAAMLKHGNDDPKAAESRQHFRAARRSVVQAMRDDLDIPALVAAEE